MAALTDVNASLLTEVQQALAAAGYPNAVVCLYYPTDDMIKAVATSGTPLVSIYLRTTNFKNTSMRYRRETDAGVCGIATSMNGNFIAPGQTLTVTLGYAANQTAVQANDAVAFFTRGDLTVGGSAVAGSSDTLATMATQLAADINTNFASQSFTAVANGATVAITNNGYAGYAATTDAGNVATGKTAVLWAFRSFQIIAYTANLDDREALQGAIENMLALADDQYGFSLPSGEMIRIQMTGGKSGDADVQKDTYRDDFIFTAGHAVDETEYLYAVLIPVFAAAPC